MKKENSNEELHSRRDFFKKAAKAALPFVAAIAIANLPTMVQSAEKASTGCNATCTYSCKSTCDSCQKSCGVGCGTTCSGKCIGSCSAVCQNSSYNS